MSARVTVVGVEHDSGVRNGGRDFWWRNQAADVVAIFHGFGPDIEGRVLADRLERAMTEPEPTSLVARARWPIERAHAAALADVTRRGAAGGSMACVAIGEGRAAIAHVGDARVYALSGPRLERLTRDHTLAESQDPADQALLRRAGFTPRVLLRAVGIEDRFDIEVSERAWAPGEVLALCTANVDEAIGADLATYLARGVDAPAAVDQHLQAHGLRKPAALALVLPWEPPPQPAPRAIDLALDADSLVILYAPDPALERWRYPLRPASTTIGRATDNDVVLADESVSRRHARLERRADGLWLIDESSNDTLVNGAPVREARVRLHDRISVGKFLLVLSAVNVPYELRTP